MSTPLDVAVDIGRIVVQAQMENLSLDAAECADEIVSRFPHTGLPRSQILDALKAEAGAIGVEAN